MTTTELQPLILTVLKQGYHVTSEQLAELINSELSGCGSPAVSRQRLLRVLQDLVRARTIERTVEPKPIYTRYRMPVPPRYFVEPNQDGIGLILVRRDSERAQTVIGKGMTDAEARACATALNHLDRDTRAGLAAKG